MGGAKPHTKSHMMLGVAAAAAAVVLLLLLLFCDGRDDVEGHVSLASRPSAGTCFKVCSFQFSITRKTSTAMSLLGCTESAPSPH